MSMLQLRNLSESTKRRLRRRARERGLTMSEYVLRLIEDDLERPTADELKGRLAQLSSIPARATGAELVEEARAEAGRD